MGAEASCTARFRGRTIAGKARLETESLEFRGPELKLSIPFKEISRVDGRDGVLTVTASKHSVSLTLGTIAEKWAHKIRHPPTRLDKIGAKPEWSASAIGVDDIEFLRELEQAVARLSIGHVAKPSDAIFYGVSRENDLRSLEKLKASLTPSGAVWVIRPKGRPDISERAVMAAGKAAGLVDVKVVSFSPTHTAEKFVIPVKARAVK